MPWSRAALTHAWAASSSTWPPWVSQLPYAISEMVRPERPSRLNSTSADVSPAATGPRSDVRAQAHGGLREPPAADHGGPADAVHDDPAGGVVRPGEPLGDGPLDLAGQDDRVGREDQEEAQQQDRRVPADGHARRDGADQRHRGDHQEEAAHVAPGVDEVARELAHGAAIPGREGGVLPACDGLPGR